MIVYPYIKKKLFQLLCPQSGNVKTIPSNDFFTKFKEKKNLKLFQVFGVPRSGTTLLASILDHHESAICLIEPILSLQTQGIILIDEKYQVKINKKHSLEDIFLFLSDKENIKLLGIKETYRTEFHHSFPSRNLIESNIYSNNFDYQIAIVRDPRDGWASIVRRDPQFQNSIDAFKEYIYSWNSICNLISFQEDIFAIKYEDLVLKTKKTISEVFNHLNISVPPKIFPLNNVLGYGDETAQKGGRIFQSSVNSYNRYLSQNEISYIKKHCSEYLLKFKYET